MEGINIALEVYSILVLALILLHMLVSEDRNKKLSRLFIWMLLFNMAVLACDLITWFYHYMPFPRPVLLVANFGVYSFGYVMVALFSAYLVTFIGTKVELSRLIIRVMYALCAVAIALVVVSQFNHMYYYFDAANEYQRGPWYWFSQAFPIGMLVANFALVVRHRRHLNTRERVSLLSYPLMPVLAMLIQIFVYGITLLYVATTFAMFIIYVSIQVEHGLRLKDRELELMDARVSIMLSQIQPHFLYNALTAIHHLCGSDPAVAQEAVAEFSGYLRANLDSLSQKTPIHFEQELEHVHNYLSLERKRFGERLRVVWDLPVHDFRIPALTLQPVVENAVRYGVTRRREGGTVTILTRETADEWHVIVHDDGVGFDVAAPLPDDGRSHVGIENVRNRLNRMCGGALHITSMPGTGTTAVLSIPKNAPQAGLSSPDAP